MRVLLDTHAFLWWLADHPSLTGAARKTIADPGNDVLVSAASAWEIATKSRLGKLPGAEDLASDFSGYLQKSHFRSLPITIEHATWAGLLAGPHRDPFDRMLIAQAQSEKVAIISNETLFDQYGVRRIW